MTISGGCLCGDVRYTAKAEPVGTGMCHCVTCRRSAGAPMVAWATWSKADLEIGGDTKSYISSTHAQRLHCPRCGTQLFFLDERYPDEIDVTIASLDDPNLVPPQKHIWAESHLRWVRLDDGVPVFAQRSVDETGQPLSPARNAS